MARLIPEKLRGKPGSALHVFRKVLKSLSDDFTAWFSLAAENSVRPQVFLVWRERYGFLVQVAETTQQLAEAALESDLFHSESTIIRPENLGRNECAVLDGFMESACREFGGLVGDLPVRKLVVFPNLRERTIDEVILLRGDDEVTYLGLNQVSAAHFERRLEALAEAALPEPGLSHLRRLFSPESVVPVSFDARRSMDRGTSPAIASGFLDFDQEWCVKNDLDLMPDQESLVRGKSGATRLVTGVAGSGKSLVLLYRALLSAKLHPSARVLVLTHNRPLRNELERRGGILKGVARNLEWFTFFQWAMKCQMDQSAGFCNRGKSNLQSLI